LLSSGTNTIRLLPPYTINDGEIDYGLSVLSELLETR
jgi:4-aminobutyrate aminotransferase-like enzyme